MSAYIIKQSERNNHPSLFRQWCSSGTWFKEWETDLLEGGGRSLYECKALCTGRQNQTH